jgi:hypothetical protein
MIIEAWLIHKMKGSHLFWLSRSKGMTVDIWIRDYNPLRCLQNKISGRGKHNDFVVSELCGCGFHDLNVVLLFKDGSFFFNSEKLPFKFV